MTDNIEEIRAALDEAEARVEEARAVALQEALNKVSGCDRVSEVGPAIRALMDTTHAEALEQVRAEEREAIIALYQELVVSHSVWACDGHTFTIRHVTPKEFAAAIRARGKS